MSGWEHALLTAAAWLSLLTFILVFELVALGQPPTHCHYLVPVKAHPGIYSCSQYPRPATAP